MKNVILETLQQRLQALSEKQLQARIVEPLLRELGFDSVRDVSGRCESGKDLVASKKELGKNVLYAIQIKKTKISGSASDSNSLRSLMNQLTETRNETVFDPTTSAERLPGVIVFISPFEIHRATFDAASSSFAELSKSQIMVIDGADLASLVYEHLPNELTMLGGHTAYLTKFLAERDCIRESKAFGPLGPKKYSEIYVNGDVDLFDSARDLILYVTRSLSDFRLECERLADQPDSPQFPKSSRNQLNDLRIKLISILAKEDSDIEGEDFFSVFCKAVKTVHRRAIDLLSLENLPSVAIESHLDACYRLQCVARTALRVPHVEAVWTEWSPATENSVTALRSILVEACRLCRASDLSNTNKSLLVVGPPGAGKTTLLNQIAAAIAQRANAPRIAFVRAIDMKDCSIDGLIRDVLSNLSEKNEQTSLEYLQELIAAGRFSLFVDGLDESGSRVHQIVEAIKLFNEKNPRVIVVASIRNVLLDSLSRKPLFIDFIWPQVSQVTMVEFSPDQLKEFIFNWYSSSPTVRRDLLEWLRHNPDLEKVVRMPVIAALLCSLAIVRRPLPSTEFDLYSGRLELLLGAWEMAKEIPPMPADERERWHDYLCNLAFQMHLHGHRSIERGAANKLAPTYIVPGASHSALSLVDDCIARGILFVEPDGRLSFGHLTFQEHLVAEYLYHNRPIELIVSKLEDDWWWKSLTFFATRMQDLSALAKIWSVNASPKLKKRIRKLTTFAPRTQLDYDYGQGG